MHLNRFEVLPSNYVEKGLFFLGEAQREATVGLEVGHWIFGLAFLVS